MSFLREKCENDNLGEFPDFYEFTLYIYDIWDFPEDDHSESDFLIVTIPLKIFKNDNSGIQTKILKISGIQPRHKSAKESEQTFIETLLCEHYRRSVFGCMYLVFDVSWRPWLIAEDSYVSMFCQQAWNYLKFKDIFEIQLSAFFQIQ